MIVIQNVSNELKPTGTHKYIVRINNGATLAQFTHNREDGLAVCLQRAADAVRKEELKQMLRVFDAW